MESNNFDQAQEVLYNEDGTAAPITVDMSKQQPLNDRKCAHDFYEDKDDADYGWARTMKCRLCPVGYFVAHE